MKYFAALLFTVAATALRAASPSFTSFSSDQFATAASTGIWIKDTAQLTNTSFFKTVGGGVTFPTGQRFDTVTVSNVLALTVDGVYNYNFNDIANVLTLSGPAALAFTWDPLGANNFVFNRPIYGNGVGITNVAPFKYIEDPFVTKTVLWTWSGAAGGSSPSVFMGQAVSTTGGSLIGVGSTNYGAHGILTNSAIAFDTSSYTETFAGEMLFQKPIFRIRFQLLNTNAASIFTAGFTTGTAASQATNQPLNAFFMVRASTTAPDTNFKIVCSDDAVTFPVVDTGIPIDALTHDVTMYYCRFGSSNIVTAIDGNFVCTNSANIPRLNSQVKAYVVTKTLDTNTKTNRFFAVGYQLTP